MIINLEYNIEGYHERFIMQILSQRIGQFLYLIHNYEFIINIS